MLWYTRASSPSSEIIPMLSGVDERRSVTTSWYSGTLTETAFSSRKRAICWAAEYLLVRIVELVADEDHATRAVVRVGEQRGRRNEVDELDPLALGIGKLLLVDHHLLAAAADDDIHVLRT